MRLYLELTEDQPPDVSKRRWREFSRDGMNECGLLYDRQLKMRHFEPGAASRYGYKTRKPKYQARKDRAVDRGSRHISPDAKNPLIHSGALRRAVRMNHQPKAFPTRFTVTMPTPVYAQMTPRRSDVPNLGVELTTVASDEQPQFEKTYHDVVETEYNEYRETRTTRIG